MIKRMMVAICMIAIGIVGLVSCGSDDGPAGPTVPMASFTVEFNDLDEIEGAVYEGWIMVDGEPISTGTFTGSRSTYTFSTVKESLEMATSFVVSIEPKNNSNSSPSDTKLLSGDFINDRAEISIAEVGDFSQISGNFEIFTPSDTNNMNEENGIWFLETVNGIQQAGLELPALNAGWKYEGWVIIDGVPVSTGTFTDVASFDDASPYSGNNPQVPLFPGEDFLSGSASSGSTTVNFPADGDVTGRQVVVSLEPFPDNDSDPFYIKPLVGTAGDALSPAPNSLLSNFTVVNRAPVGLVER